MVKALKTVGLWLGVTLLILLAGGVWVILEYTLVNRWVFLGCMVVIACALTGLCYRLGRLPEIFGNKPLNVITFGLIVLIVISGITLSINYFTADFDSEQPTKAVVARKYQQTRHRSRRSGRHSYERGEPYQVYFVDLRLLSPTLSGSSNPENLAPTSPSPLETSGSSDPENLAPTSPSPLETSGSSNPENLAPTSPAPLETSGSTDSDNSVPAISSPTGFSSTDSKNSSSSSSLYTSAKESVEETQAGRKVGSDSEVKGPEKMRKDADSEKMRKDADSEKMLKDADSEKVLKVELNRKTYAKVHKSDTVTVAISRGLLRLKVVKPSTLRPLHPRASKPRKKPSPLSRKGQREEV